MLTRSPRVDGHDRHPTIVRAIASYVRSRLEEPKGIPRARFPFQSSDASQLGGPMCRESRERASRVLPQFIRLEKIAPGEATKNGGQAAEIG